MSPFFDWIFAQYQDIPVHLIILEMVGVFFGFLSVWYSMRENILVFPTGIISTGLFVYILFVFGLLGDMLINAYYFAMSVYGWYLWTRKVDETHFIPITTTNAKEKKWTVVLFVATILFVVLVYVVFDKLESWTAYVDTFTTAVFFVGMWLMAKKKLENWERQPCPKIWPSITIPFGCQNMLVNTFRINGIGKGKLVSQKIYCPSLKGRSNWKIP